MALRIIREDILKIKVDAIVNSTNHYLIGFSGVDQLIHEKAGPEFDKECELLAMTGKLVPGEAVSTKGYELNAKYVIHTIGPNWDGGIHGEAAVLRSAYRSSMKLAGELGCRSVSFPLISSGVRDYPIHMAFGCAVESIEEYLALYTDEDDPESRMDVYLVLHGAAAERIDKAECGELSETIKKSLKKIAGEEKSLEQKVHSPGKDFVDMLYEFMNRKGIEKNSQLYSKVGITKGAWSKIIGGGTKRPSMKTACALAIGLELSIEETEAFLASAGWALSDSSTFDIIVRYFIENGIYDIWEIDVQLLKYKCDTFTGMK